MDSDARREEAAQTRPAAPQVVALGLNHALCVAKAVTFRQASVTAESGSTARSSVVDAALHVYSWGKGAFNCLGHGLETVLAKAPKRVRFFERKNISQVACGDYHSAVLVLPRGAASGTGGTVYTFGLGSDGRLGYTITNRGKQSGQAGEREAAEEGSWCTTNPQPVGLSVNLKHNVVALACGANHTLVTTVDGSLFAWGIGAFGVLGTGDCQNRHVPARVEFPFETSMRGCAAGCRHSFGVDSEGRVWAWGYGGNGRLGTGNTRTTYAPKMLQALDQYHVTQVSCGDSHSACIDSAGKLYTWGSSRGGKLGHRMSDEDVLVPTIVEALAATKIVQVACGTAVTLALCEGGSVYQWGSILGFVPASATTVPHVAHVPQKVPNVGSKNVFIAAGPYSCAAVNAYGDLRTWGVGSSFRLGHSSVADCLEPKFVAELRSKIFVDALLMDRGHAQQEAVSGGLVDFRAANSANEKRIQQLSVGFAHGALLTCNGSVYTWGARKGTGLAQDGENTETYYEPKLLNHFSTKIKRIACGSNHTLVVTVEGLVFAWGSNDSGQLGLGDLRPRGFPEHVSTLEYAINVFAGFNNSCCVTTTKHDNFASDEVGAAWVFGAAAGGKLGLGDECTATVIMTPRKITCITGIYKVVLGNTHTLLLQHEGLVYATGTGADGRLGTGSVEAVTSFTRVKSALKFIDIAVGASHSLAVSVEHDLYGWGKGRCITKGDEAVLEPVLIEGLPSQVGVAKVHAVAAFANHSFVVTDQGHLIAWGDNSSAQLGVPLATNEAKAIEFIDRPSLVLLDHPVTSVVTSRSFAACMTLNGDAYAWGASSDGRLGIGETRDKVVYKPTAIATVNLMGDLMEQFENMALSNDIASYASAVESLLNELHFREDKDVVDWRSLQMLLKNEERLCWESSLRAFEDDVVKCLKQHVDFILDMDRYHQDVSALQFKLEVAIQGFVNRLGSPKPQVAGTDAQQLQPYTQFAPEMEQLVEIVFLQPAYFVRLCLFGNDLDTVESLVTCVYNRVEMPLVHNHFVALLLALLREEIQLCFNPQTPLNASRSPFARMLRAYATSEKMTAGNARLFYSEECAESFLNFMKSHPLVLPHKAAPKSEELNSFTKFTVHLHQVLGALKVPRYVKLAFKRMYSMVKFKIPPGWALPNVPLENVAVYPLIPVFVYAVLQPFFSNAGALAGGWIRGLMRCNAGAASHGYDGVDEAAAGKFQTASEYFDYIVNPSLRMAPASSPEVNRVTMALYRNVSLMLLEYIKTLLDVEDTFNIDVTMATFKSHFDLEKIRVEAPSWLIAQFVNGCAATRRYLNLSAHDPLCKLLDAMRPSPQSRTQGPAVFGEMLIQALRHRKKVTTVDVEHRFLMYDKSMSICKFSGVFLPQRLAYRQTTYSEDCVKLMSLIVRYVPFGKYDPPRVVQNALAELKQIDVAPGGFDALIAELDGVAEFYTQLASPDYAAANRARGACAQLMKIDRRGTTPSDLAAAILRKALERHHQRRYLLRVYKRQGEIESCRIHFEAAFREKCRYLAACISHASTAYVEPCIQNAAIAHRVKLHSAKLASCPPPSRTETAAFSLSTLQKNGRIICRRDEDLPRLAQLFVVFTVEAKSACRLSLQARSDDGRGAESLDTCEVPLHILEAWSEGPHDGFAELFTSQAYPQGLLGVRKRFLVETFAQLMG
ncbi:regulator of chromosome condensation repeat-containing protein [Babesia caballi]|uniref:Regulator of chromosome condensation repeat-containing protein n=1 Tax=Babesia caballi TaxID=5871 RepID=A0AAV4LZQ6_BABCB|nr:regulator of chromosome condensation repeat-containing protein [Babesia caballi]